MSVTIYLKYNSPMYYSFLNFLKTLAYISSLGKFMFFLEYSHEIIQCTREFNTL